MVKFTTAPRAAAAAALCSRGAFKSGATLLLAAAVATALSGCAATSWVTTRFTDEAPATASAPAPAATAAAPAQPSRFIGASPAAPAAAPAAPVAAAAAPAAIAAPLAPAAVAARGAMTPAEAAAILADIEPSVEPLSAQGNKPYYAFGRRHTPFTDGRAYSERGAIGVIESRLQGKATANGETHDMGAMAAAHLTLPLPSYVRVTNLKSGASTIVRVNDRGPARRDRLIELSPAAADRLKLREGEQVEVVRLLPAEIAQIRERRAIAAAVVAPAAAPVAAAMPVPAPAPATVAQPVPPVARAAPPAAATVAVAAAPAAAPAQPTAAMPYPPGIGPIPPGMPSSSLPSAVPGVPAGPTPVGPMPPGASVAAPVAGAAAAGTAVRAAAPAAPAAPGDDLRAGRYSVQVATFAVESNALTLRDRVAGQMKSAGIAAPVRVISRNARAVVAVGDLGDKAAADALAEQLRRTLNQDVVVFRR